MSRCYPFPPPGYVKENRNDNVELLAKEKRKEKKHKKEKRDKEKKEGKERKVEGSSKEKKREKKDRKERHKDKDREKDKNKITDEKYVEKRFVGHKEGTVDQRSLRIDDNKDSRFTEELARRIRDDERCTGNQTVDKFALANQRRIEEMCRSTEEIDKRIKGKEKIEYKELDEKKTNRLNGKEKIEDKKADEKKTDRLKGKEKIEDKKADEKKTDMVKGKEKIEDKKGDKKKTDGLRDGDKDKDRDREKRRSKGKDKERDKERDKEKEKGKGKHKERDKQRKGSKKDQVDPTLTIKATFPGMNSEKISLFPCKDPKDQIDTPLPSKKDQVDPTLTIKATFPGKNSEKISVFPFKDPNDQIDTPLPINATLLAKDSQKNFLFPEKDSNTIFPEVNLRKRKDFEANGFLHDNYMQPNKLPRLDSSSRSQMENGRKVETSHLSIPYASGREGASDNKTDRVVNNKEHKINGKIEARPSLNNLRPIENGGESSEPPHPDSQYLSQILSIPKMEECLDFDDQEWLFGNDNLRPKAKEVGAEVDVGIPRVWEKTLRIESEDMYALPYVLPF